MKTTLLQMPVSWVVTRTELNEHANLRRTLDELSQELQRLETAYKQKGDAINRRLLAGARIE
jgi:hypothetical protein